MKQIVHFIRNGIETIERPVSITAQWFLVLFILIIPGFTIWSMPLLKYLGINIGESQLLLFMIAPGIFSLGMCLFAPVISVMALWDYLDSKYPDRRKLRYGKRNIERLTNHKQRRVSDA